MVTLGNKNVFKVLKRILKDNSLKAKAPKLQVHVSRDTLMNAARRLKMSIFNEVLSIIYAPSRKAH